MRRLTPIADTNATHSTLHHPRAPARDAEPRLGAVLAELSCTQFDDIESRFDGESGLARGALRWTEVPRPAFGRVSRH